VSKLLAATTLAEPNSEPPDRQVSSACPAQAAVVEHDRTVSASPALEEAVPRIVRLLARQQAWEDLSSQGEGG
jgi:hypothetical protein